MSLNTMMNICEDYCEFFGIKRDIPNCHCRSTISWCCVLCCRSNSRSDCLAGICSNGEHNDSLEAKGFVYRDIQTTFHYVLDYLLDEEFIGQN